MFVAYDLNLKNLDVIAPLVGVSRSSLNYFYETNSYRNEHCYVVVELDGDTTLSFEVLLPSNFNQIYMYIDEDASPEVIKI